MDRNPAPAPAGAPPFTGIVFVLLLALGVLALSFSTGACAWRDAGPRDEATAAPGAAPAPWSASASPDPATGPQAAPPSAAAGTITPSSAASVAAADARVIAAAAVVRRFCSLVDKHRYGAARVLLASPSVWPLRDLQTVRRLRFDTVQTWGEPGEREVTLLVTFTATVTWRSPLTDGINDVFFTLTRRVTTGEWLIAAVSTSP